MQQGNRDKRGNKPIRKERVSLLFDVSTEKETNKVLVSATYLDFQTLVWTLI